jgi:uncharacterized protein involved in exopolysaccharide biosynthesis
MAPSSPSNRTTPPRQILSFLLRNRYLIVAVSLFVTFWMLVYTFVVYRPVFSAKSVVIIKDSAITSRYVETEQYYAMQTTSSSSSNPVLNTMGILKSGAISDALWEYFSKKRPDQLKKNKIKTKGDWVKFFQDGSAFIKAKNQPGTDLIAIQFSWSDPAVAKGGLEIVVKAFQDASRDLNKQEQITRTKFLQQQVTEIEEQLDAVRKQKSEYQSRKGTVNVQKEGNDLAGTRMELENRLNQLESQVRGKENLARRYQQMLGMTPDKALRAAALGQNGSLSRLQDELYRLEQQYSQLSASLTETNPKVQEVKAQIEQVRSNIEAEKARTLSMAGGKAGAANTSVVADPNRARLVDSMLSALAEAQDLNSQAAVVRGRLAEIDRNIKDFPSVAEGLANIEQKELSLSLALDNLRKKALEGKLKEEQTLSNVFVVDAPRYPDKPKFPNRVHLLALSLILGVGAGLAAAVGKEQFMVSHHSLPSWLDPVEDDENEGDAPVDKGEASRPAYASAARHPIEDTAVETAPAAAGPLSTELPDEEPLDDAPLTASTDGSLFDALAQAPQRKPYAQPPVSVSRRTDLTQSLIQPDPLANPHATIEALPEELPAHPDIPNSIPMNIAEMLAETVPLKSQTPAELVVTAGSAATAEVDAYLLPPQSLPIARHSRIRQAKPVTRQLIERVQATSIRYEQATGIPALHALPADTQPATSDLPQASLAPEPMAAPEFDTNSGADEAGIRFRPQPVLAKRLSVEDMVNRLQEGLEQTEEVGTPAPASRKLRSLPTFLLDAPEVTAQASETTPFPESAPTLPDAPKAQPERLPIPAFMREEAKTRTPLKASMLWFRKQPNRHPESYFGLSRRQKSKGQLNLPGSLNLWKQSLESSGPSAG